jgi:hypothetical protein
MLVMAEGSNHSGFSKGHGVWVPAFAGTTDQPTRPMFN